MPGEEDLPTTLGGEPGGGEAGGAEGGGAPEGGGEAPPPAEGVSPGSFLPLLQEEFGDEDDVDEKRNPGSEGNDSSVMIGKGKDLFNTGEDPNKLVFGTEKQTASDPYDMRALMRLIRRPFSEGSRKKKGPDETDKRMKEVIRRTQTIEEDVKRALSEVKKLSKRSKRYRGDRGTRGNGDGED